MLSLKEDILVAVIGAGTMGKGLVYQSYITPGMKPVAIADLRIENAIACAQAMERDYEIVRYSDSLNRAVERGRLALTDNAELVASSELINVLIEASGAPVQGAIHAMKAIQHHQHVVMVNDEAGMMYGPLLLQMANEEGVVYTACDGSHQAAIKKLIDDIDLWGFNLVMAGTIEGAIDRYAAPSRTLVSGTDRQQLYKGERMDGTKVSIELSVLANAINGRAAVPGMNGFSCASVQELVQKYDLSAAWANEVPLVDYITAGETLQGVFVVGHTDHPFQRDALRQIPGMGPGPFYTFHRPFHISYLEAMECVMEAYFNGTSRLQPSYGMKTNVFAYAKKDLQRGEVLGGVGGHQVYGLIENLGDNKHDPGLPVCLAGGLTVKNDLARDQRIILDDVDYDPDDVSFSLYFRALHANTQRTVLTKARIVPSENLQYIIPM